MASNTANTAKNDGESVGLMEPSSIAPTTSAGSKATDSSHQPESEPQPFQWLVEWLSEVIGQGVEAAHVFCGTDEATVKYQIGENTVEVSIGAKHFIVLEIPNDPMTGPGYRIFSRGR